MKILMVIDAQNDFITGSLGSDDAKYALANIIERIKLADYNTIIFTMDTHHQNYLNTPEGIALPVMHCLKGTNGWCINNDVTSAFYNEAKKHPNKLKISFYEKETFGSVELANEIKNASKYDDNSELNIEICGFCTDICVIANALILKTVIPDASISINSHCCAGTSHEKHFAALEVAKSCQ